MLTRSTSAISIPGALRLVGVIAGVWALLVATTTTLAYLPEHPEFSLLATYPSDMADVGATPGWPPILWNSGTLIAAPLRFLVTVLLALRLTQLGAGRAFVVSALVLGLASSTGTVLMTAVPFSVGPTIHKLGIGLYFLGVVCLQTVIGLREWSLSSVPRLLPALSFLMVFVYATFAILVMLYELGTVGRNTPVIWEWLAFFSSVVWVFAQAFGLGKETSRTRIDVTIEAL